jgi:hypothetical protein
MQAAKAQVESFLSHLPVSRLYDMVLGAVAITLLGICVTIPVAVWILLFGRGTLPPESAAVLSATATLQTSDSLLKSTLDVSTESIMDVTPTLSRTATLTPFPTDTPQPTPTATTAINYYYTPFPSLTPTLTPTPILRLTPGKGRLRIVNNMTVNIRVILNTNNLTYDVERGKTHDEYPPLGVHGWQIIAGACRLSPPAIRIEPTVTVTVFAPSAGKCEITLTP